MRLNRLGTFIMRLAFVLLAYGTLYSTHAQDMPSYENYLGLSTSAILQKEKSRGSTVYAESKTLISFEGRYASSDAVCYFMFESNQCSTINLQFRDLHFEDHETFLPKLQKKYGTPKADGDSHYEWVRGGATIVLEWNTDYFCWQLYFTK